MNGPIVLDEFHLTLFLPPDCPEAQVRAARRVLARPRFRTRLLRAICELLREVMGARLPAELANDTAPGRVSSPEFVLDLGKTKGTHWSVIEAA